MNSGIETIWAPPRPLTTSTCQVCPIYSHVDPTTQPTRITSIHTHLGPLSELTGWRALICACASPPQVAYGSVLATGVGTPEGAARQLLDRLWRWRRLPIPPRSDAIRSARLAPGACSGAARELPECGMRSRACFARRCFCDRIWDRIRASRGPSQRSLSQLSGSGAVPRDQLV